jgi:hypothetical protein
MSDPDVREGIKLTERALRADHPITRRRIEIVSAMEYDLFVHDQPEALDRTKPIFTIILLLHDGKRSFVEESLSSVFAQTYANTEVIIINNGAHGTVGDMIWRAFVDHRNAKLIRLPKNLHNPTAHHLDDPIPNLWNAALFCSVGDFAYFVSYDDSLGKDYVERMVALFEGNDECCTAAPMVVSINDTGDINEGLSRVFADGNARGRYTDGIELVRSYMRGSNAIRFPGGILAVRSDLVLSLGGFDGMNDFSQLFKFAINGVSGFDPAATLFWRHHAEQLNKHQKRMGLVYYRTFREFREVNQLRALHERVGGSEFAAAASTYMDDIAKQIAIASFRDSCEYGPSAGFSALKRLLKECPPRVGAAALTAAGRDLLTVGYTRHVPEPAKKLYRSVKRALRR